MWTYFQKAVQNRLIAWIMQARRTGAVVATDKKLTAGSNKAHQGQLLLSYPLSILTSLSPGTDHQRIAKLDRENEVAPPPKISPQVGRVCFAVSRYPMQKLILGITRQYRLLGWI